eukprot:CAMPEP_0172568556 /NCGR_PEP_ID=MMETSP1067-20121228/120408_1 /TAXON_ID=265564 ORGANISM="Thalassiosira punctigera, Strain Tpunct2005C2" /NCGR_SAMPLE_ID=MMETSP1067 /ASSEMBLY_ACC=CAM_ASM_000444 /LENGTH=366 /DNA_ID=CAMNT_0013360191 /DNA_START=48 /DNA_END=1148 /DNA_ORIENTATION=-
MFPSNNVLAVAQPSASRSAAFFAILQELVASTKELKSKPAQIKVYIFASLFLLSTIIVLNLQLDGADDKHVDKQFEGKDVTELEYAEQVASGDSASEADQDDGNGGDVQGSCYGLEENVVESNASPPQDGDVPGAPSPSQDSGGRDVSVDKDVQFSGGDHGVDFGEEEDQKQDGSLETPFEIQDDFGTAEFKDNNVVEEEDQEEEKLIVRSSPSQDFAPLEMPSLSEDEEPVTTLNAVEDFAAAAPSESPTSFPRAIPEEKVLVSTQKSVTLNMCGPFLPGEDATAKSNLSQEDRPMPSHPRKIEEDDATASTSESPTNSPRARSEDEESVTSQKSATLRRRLSSSIRRSRKVSMKKFSSVKKFLK